MRFKRPSIHLLTVAEQAMKAEGRKQNANKGVNKQVIHLDVQEGQALTSSLSGQSSTMHPRVYI